jgi:hypothetical protein
LSHQQHRSILNQNSTSIPAALCSTLDQATSTTLQLHQKERRSPLLKLNSGVRALRFAMSSAASEPIGENHLMVIPAAQWSDRGYGIDTWENLPNKRKPLQSWGGFFVRILGGEVLRSPLPTSLNSLDRRIIPIAIEHKQVQINFIAQGLIKFSPQHWIAHADVDAIKYQIAEARSPCLAQVGHHAAIEFNPAIVSRPSAIGLEHQGV